MLTASYSYIRFTMETEQESKIAFLDTSVSREPDGRLTTSVYRKPTHTDQYLVYDSHHPQSVKRSTCVRGPRTPFNKNADFLDDLSVNARNADIFKLVF